MSKDLRGFRKNRLIPYFLMTFCILVLDQITKYLVTTRLDAGESIPLIEGVFHITSVLNKGIAFGWFKKNMFIPEIISFFVIGAILIFFIRFSKNRDSLVNLGLALILAGCIGNLIDRLRIDAVIDFLDFRVWPVFNIADAAISSGAFLLFLGIITERRMKKL